MKKLIPKPGDIVELAGIKFVVLDDLGLTPGEEYAHSLFVLTMESQGKSQFGESNNYKGSKLCRRMEEWLNKLLDHGYNRKLFYARNIDLTTLDGRGTYGTYTCLAAPLTIDEAREYANVIPNCDDLYWLSTGWGAEGTDCRLTLNIDTDGYLRGEICNDKFLGVRPALIISSILLPCYNSTNLSEVSDEELLEEIDRRFKKKGDLDVAVYNSNTVTNPEYVSQGG